MTVIGADPEQLRSTAMQFTQAADRLQGSLKSLAGLVSHAGFWRGPDSERFRSDFNGQSVYSMNAAIEALRNGAEVLRRNADEQDHASRAEGGSGSGGDGAMRSRPSAQGLGDMWKELHSIPNTDDSSGYRVQKVIGPDGVERYVVYIVGTFGSETQTLDSNISAIQGKLDRDAAQVEALKRLIPDGKEVMLVGYSQGGIDAQNIAASGEFNVQQIVTFGSPVRNDINIPAIHLQDTLDPIPGTGLFNSDLYSARAQDGNDNVEVFSARSNSSVIDTLLDPSGMGYHQNGYTGLSEKWDNAALNNADARAADASQGLTKFGGDTVRQVDIDKNGNGSW